MTASIIYISSNRENPEFERRLREDLLSKTDLPITSVTQKPIDFGENICIGDVGASGFNFCRQVQIALENIDEDIVISAESDCLYSPDYFHFRPERLDVPYRNTNIYVQKYGEDFVCKKSMSTFSQVVGRDFYLDRLNELLEGQPQWSTELKNFPKEIKKPLFKEFAYFRTEFACLSFKTGRGMRRHSNSDGVPVYELPYWGKISEVRSKYEAK